MELKSKLHRDELLVSEMSGMTRILWTRTDAMRGSAGWTVFFESRLPPRVEMSSADFQQVRNGSDFRALHNRPRLGRVWERGEPAGGGMCPLLQTRLAQLQELRSFFIRILWDGLVSAI